MSGDVEELFQQSVAFPEVQEAVESLSHGLGVLSLDRSFTFRNMGEESLDLALFFWFSLKLSRSHGLGVLSLDLSLILLKLGEVSRELSLDFEVLSWDLDENPLSLGVVSMDFGVMSRDLRVSAVAP
jgi:hypothetical protein